MSPRLFWNFLLLGGCPKIGTMLLIPYRTNQYGPVCAVLRGKRYTWGVVPSRSKYQTVPAWSGLSSVFRAFQHLTGFHPVHDTNSSCSLAKELRKNWLSSGLATGWRWALGWRRVSEIPSSAPRSQMISDGANAYDGTHFWVFEGTLN